jgi:hypothetical protein
LVLPVVLSPKAHAQDDTVPVVVFVNATLSGAVPVAGEALKLTLGAAYGIDTGSSAE